MAHSVNHVLAQMQRWTAAQTADLSDAVLLARYVQHGDEDAFAALVARYGAMVLRVCRRILGANSDAEDAFQAAFLILARKAPSLRQADALPGWLHSVTRRVALKARTQANRGFSSISPLDATLTDPSPDPLTQLTARELLIVVDEEVQRLPAPQRSAVVLCCLEGQTREEAARQLGWTPAALKSHLQRGRQRLQKRLESRGIALPAALAMVALARGETASALLLRSTATAALHGGIGSAAAALAHSVLKGMFLAKLIGLMSVTLSIALAASTTIALFYRDSALELPEGKAPAPPAAAKDADTNEPQARTDALGDPLPEGAVARLGTVRFRQGDEIARVTFTPDGKRVVSLGRLDGGVVRVWDAATGKELRHFVPELGDGWWEASDLSSDGKHVASVSGRVPYHLPAGLIELWDVDSGKKIGTLGESFFHPVRFSPDGKWLAASSNGTDVEIWELATRKKLRSWQAHPRSLWNIAFSADSRKLVTSGSMGEVRVWDAATGRQLQELGRKHGANEGYEAVMALSPDGKLLALIEANEKRVSASGKVEWKARISVQDTASGKVVRQLICPAYDIVPGSPRPFRAVTFTPDGKGLITSGPDHFIRIWDANSGEELRRLPLEELPGPLALSRDGKKLAVVVWSGKAIRVLDMTGGQALTPPGGHLMEVIHAALTPDGRTAVTGSPLGSLAIWDVKSGKLSRRLNGNDGPVVALRLGSDGQTLYTLGWDKTLRVWDLATLTERRRIAVEHEQDRLQRCGLTLTPDGKTLAVISDSGKTIRILDADNGTERQHIPAPEGLLNMRLTPDGRSLIVWSGDCKVRIWDTASGRKLREYALPQSSGDGPSRVRQEQFNAALSHDGRLLAMGPQSRPHGKKWPATFMILKDLATGQIVRRIDNMPSEPALVAFSPDDRTLAWTCYKDPSIRLLETATGRERRRFVGHRGRITALAFSADSRKLLSGSSDTTALVWDLSGARAPRPATAAELEALWADLAGEDAARAYQAIHKLAASFSSAIPFVNKCLRPVAAVDEKRLTRPIADLDSDDFAKREEAAAELQKLGERALPAYRKALEGKPSLEMRRRLDELLDKAQRAWWDVSGERLRSLRAIEALEFAGTQAARQLLKKLATGAEGARLTAEAKAALERLGTAPK